MKLQIRIPVLTTAAAALVLSLIAAVLIFDSPLSQTALAQGARKSSSTSHMQGKGAPVVTLKSVKGTPSGADPNIKSDSQTNNSGAKIDAPPSKGGPRSRGGNFCEVRVDNRTNLFVKIYVDGSYRGTIAPYGDAVANAYAGETKVYARADMDDGTYFYWGPEAYDCGTHEYIPFRLAY